MPVLFFLKYVLIQLVAILSFVFRTGIVHLRGLCTKVMPLLRRACYQAFSTRDLSRRRQRLRRKPSFHEALWVSRTIRGCRRS